MSGQFLLDFSALAVSLFNTFLLFWLGLTVLFTTERRTLGVWVAVAGLLIGGAFFLTHSVILSGGASVFISGFNFWWQVGWLPVIAAPLSWYLLMLWYSGYWDEVGFDLRRRQRPWFWLVLVYTFLLVGLLVSANPFAGSSPGAFFETGSQPGFRFIPLLVLAYPPYAVLTITLALACLIKPAPSERLLGDLARRRARPWLVGASFVLLLVGLIIGVIFIWLVQYTWIHPTLADLVYVLSTSLSLLDLLVASLIMLAVLLLGQALVSYEVFTGKSLPRRGFLVQWRNSVLLGIILAVFGAWAQTASFPSIYILIGGLLIVALAFALQSWSSFADREESVRRLRPFVGSQRLFENILTPASPETSAANLETPLATLCADLLGARRAALVPLGSLASLCRTPLYYPSAAAFDLPSLPGLLKHFTSPQMIGLPLEADQNNGLVWVAPLWSERGLVGLLFLGGKQDGGIYAVEEIEIARAGGERLADIMASAELARRLVALQRQRLSESAVIDRRTRRILHDEVLPRLHTTLLQLSALSERTEHGTPDVLESLSDVHRQISDLLRDLPAAAAPEIARMGFLAALQQVVRSELFESFEEVCWQVPKPAQEKLDSLSPIFAEVLYFAAREAFRNAARHARSPGSDHSLRLVVTALIERGLILQIEDNGIGFLNGRKPLSTSDSEPLGVAEGSGQGLALHSTLMTVIGGSLTISSRPAEFTRISLELPQTLWEDLGRKS